MLAQLKAVHAELREAIAALDVETARTMPDSQTLSAARLRLSRTSHRRQALLECSIYPCLHDVAADDARKIADLRTEAATMLVRSSEHIGRWTMAAIAADWPGYGAASAAVRATMLRRIATESATLYPLLMAKGA